MVIVYWVRMLLLFYTFVCLVFLLICAGQSNGQILHKGVIGYDPFESVRSVTDSVFERSEINRNQRNEVVLGNGRSLHFRKKFSPGLSFLEKHTAIKKTEKTPKSSGSKSQPSKKEEKTPAPKKNAHGLLNYCDICINMIDAWYSGYSTFCERDTQETRHVCFSNMESLIHADKLLLTLLKEGCLEMTESDWRIRLPCPSHAICSWMPNLSSRPQATGKNDVDTLCARTPRFLPFIPQRYKTLQNQPDFIPDPAENATLLLPR